MERGQAGPPDDLLSKLGAQFAAQLDEDGGTIRFTLGMREVRSSNLAVPTDL
jgi:hypothetical protein